MAREPLTAAQHKLRAQRLITEEKILEGLVTLRLSGAWIQQDAKNIYIHVPGVNRDGTHNYTNPRTTAIPRKKPSGA